MIFILTGLVDRSFYLFAVWVTGNTVTVSYLHHPAAHTEIIQSPAHCWELVQSENATVVVVISLVLVTGH